MLGRPYSITKIQNLLCFLKSITFLLSLSYFQSVTSAYSLLNYSNALLSEVRSRLKEGIPDLIKKNKKLKQTNKLINRIATKPLMKILPTLSCFFRAVLYTVTEHFYSC